MSSYWPTGESNPSSTEPMKEFARIWVRTPKIVFSSTLDSVEGNARLVRGDVSDELAKVRQEFSGDLEVGGATLASAFIRAGLVDEYALPDGRDRGGNAVLPEAGPPAEAQANRFEALRVRRPVPELRPGLI